MMSLLLALALVAGLTVVPVMVGARVVGAQHTGIGAALLSVIGLLAVSYAVGRVVSHEALAFALAALGGAAMLAAFLGTTLLRGLLVSVIMVAVQTVVIVLLAGVFAVQTATAG